MEWKPSTAQIEYNARRKYDIEKHHIEQERQLQEIRDLEMETILAAKDYNQAVLMGNKDKAYQLNIRVNLLASRLSIKHLI